MNTPLKAKDISQTLTALADQLSSEMQTVMSKAMKSQTDAISKALSDGDFQEAQQLTRELIFKDAISLSRSRVLAFTRATALTGAGAIDKPKNTIFASGAPFPAEVDKSAVTVILNGVLKGLEKNTRRTLERRIVASSTFQKAEGIDPAKLATDINKFLRGEIRRVVNVSANVTGTRVAAHGMYYEARVRGISQYRLDAVHDTNTTEICKNLDGKIFDVETAFNRSGKVLAITDPDTQKREAPFPPQLSHEIEKLMELSDEELQARGFDTPPFHFLCRTVVTLISKDASYDPVAWSDFPTLDQTAAAVRVMQPRYERQARKVFNEPDLDKLFETALRSGDDFHPDLGNLQNYTGFSFNQINDAMRTNAVLKPDGLATAKTIEEMLERGASTAPNVTYAYRGVTANVAEKFKVGKIFQDDAFMSTSLSAEVASDFTAGGALLQIQIGTGQKVLPAFPASQLHAELELILPRGSQLRIIGVDTTGDIPVYRAVLQGQGDVLKLDRIGIDDLPEVSSIVKADNPTQAKFMYEVNHLREATF